jgi:hypothetical protein
MGRSRADDQRGVMRPPMKARAIVLLLPAILWWACRTSVPVTSTIAHPPVPEHEAFAILPVEDTLDVRGLVFIGYIDIADRLTAHCDYYHALDSATAVARSRGANILKVDEHRPPASFGNSCHRIKGRLYRGDAHLHQKRSFWRPDRRLSFEDMRGVGSPDDAGMRTSSGLFYKTRVVVPNTAIIRIHAWFDPEQSFVEPSMRDEALLRQEQMLFDLAEVHARSLRKTATETSFAIEVFDAQFAHQYEQAVHALRMERERFATEMRQDPKALDRWSAAVHEQLAMLSEHSDPLITLEIDR